MDRPPRRVRQDFGGSVAGYLPPIDSLTQVVLGAAVGELAAGRRLGNRAMLWGGLAGTIPDLDVTAGLVADPVTNLAFHRCVTHSLYYAALASPVLAWAVSGLYAGPGTGPADGYLARRWLPALLGVYALVVVGSLASPTPLHGVWGYSAVVTAATLLVPLLYWVYRQVNPRDDPAATAPYTRWLALFALGIGTHPLLDCFTTYGTQVLQPFDDLRVAWNTVAVADPLYTLPFLLLLLGASRALRQNPWRRRLTWAGLALSSAYLAFTVFNHARIRDRVARDLDAAGVAYERFAVTPTLFNNVLWSVAVDQGDTLRTGRIGLFDEPFRLVARDATPGSSGGAEGLTPWAQRDDLIADLRDERAVEVATWFSDGYYVVSEAPGDTLELVDLRFGTLPLEGASPVFGFLLYPRGPDREWGFRQKPIREGGVDFGAMFGKLWDRVKGGRVDVDVPGREGR